MFLEVQLNDCLMLKVPDLVTTQGAFDVRTCLAFLSRACCGARLSGRWFRVTLWETNDSPSHTKTHYIS